MVSLVFTFLCFSSSRRLLQLSQGSIFKLSWLLVKGKSWSNKESSSAWRAGCAPFTGLSWASESSSATTTRSLLKRESPSSLTSSEKSKALVSFKKSGASSFLSRDLRRFHAPGPAMAAEGRRLRLHRRSGSSGQRRASLPIVRRTRPVPPAAPRSRASSGVARDPTVLSYPGPPPPPPRIPSPEARAAASRTGIEAELQPLRSPARLAPLGEAGRGVWQARPPPAPARGGACARPWGAREGSARTRRPPATRGRAQGAWPRVAPRPRSSQPRPLASEVRCARSPRVCRGKVPPGLGVTAHNFPPLEVGVGNLGSDLVYGWPVENVI